MKMRSSRPKNAKMELKRVKREEAGAK